MDIPLFIQRLTSLFVRPNRLRKRGMRLTSPSQSARTEKAPEQRSYSQSLEREIRSQRKFTLAEAIGREGGSFIKDESAIPRPLRAIAQINHFIAIHSPDPNSPFSDVLKLWAKEDLRVSRHLDAPLTALTQIIQSLLNDPETFQEFFRRVAIAQSQLTGDRPYFQQPNCPPHPDAVYSHKSVKHQLSEILHKLQQDLNEHP